MSVKPFENWPIEGCSRPCRTLLSLPPITATCIWAVLAASLFFASKLRLQRFFVLLQGSFVAHGSHFNFKVRYRYKYLVRGMSVRRAPRWLITRPTSQPRPFNYQPKICYPLNNVVKEGVNGSNLSRSMSLPMAKKK